ncbi:uncharacterized protein PFL1_06165 [Pseudozyma flocculosa PF-1]|uniref:Uncharacterized protein n=2 Tax=Pseudozyma flocculosa TaxID=84751 RepID=A0A5C3F9Y3_9BASI|nr:uncharacterized protein PFL1_06165 [Pseudozyma flocculosa PF-1]EPQ26230.1 hypothetical protein PFL1_06165 [Pseudozyma flocculosa PF-1]SPO40189.1 uncharacterized protein PSFLO_05671 [Pseudozyma flocculosa]
MAYKALHQRFDLLAPPRRSVWALGRPHERQRAWLRDFEAHSATPVEDLGLFLHNLFLPDLGRATYVQIKVLTATLACLGVFILLITGRRLYKRSLWVFRLVQRSNGSLVVPNPVSALTTIFLGFGILLIGMNALFLRYYEQGWRPRHIFLWIAVVWFPLANGAYLVALGTFYARPDALQCISPSHPPSTLVQRLGITPRVVNLAFLAIPFIQASLIVWPAHLSDFHYQSALAKYYAWRQRWPDSTTGLNREMLLEAQAIWYELLTASRYLSATNVIWGLTSLFNGVAEMIVGGALVLTVRRQIKKLRGFKANKSFSESFALEQRKKALEGQADEAQEGSGGGAAGSAPSRPSARRKLRRPARHQKTLGATLWSLHRRFVAKRDGNDSDSEDEDEDEMVSVCFTHAQVKEDRPAPTFFPAVKPSTFQRAPRASTKRGTRQKRHYLERFWVDHLVQTIAMVAGCMMYAFGGTIAALIWYPFYESGKTVIPLTYIILAPTYSAAVCGLVIYTLILGRTYEPLLSSKGDDQDAAPPQRPAPKAEDVQVGRRPSARAARDARGRGRRPSTAGDESDFESDTHGDTTKQRTATSGFTGQSSTAFDTVDLGKQADSYEAIEDMPSDIKDARRHGETPFVSTLSIASTAAVSNLHKTSDASLYRDSDHADSKTDGVDTASQP